MGRCFQIRLTPKSSGTGCAWDRGFLRQWMDKGQIENNQCATEVLLFSFGETHQTCWFNLWKSIDFCVLKFDGSERKDKEMVIQTKLFGDISQCPLDTNLKINWKWGLHLDISFFLNDAFPFMALNGAIDNLQCIEWYIHLWTISQQFLKWIRIWTKLNFLAV